MSPQPRRLRRAAKPCTGRSGRAAPGAGGAELPGRRGLPGGSRREPGKSCVAPRVVADLADARRRARGDRPETDAAADVEEGRSRVRAAQFAYERGRVWARAVVEREREAVAARPGAVNR